MNAIGSAWRHPSVALGPVGLIALAMLGSTLLFHVFALKPLEERSAMLLAQLERRGASAVRDPVRLTRVSGGSARLAVFYRFFEREESATDFLARLYALANDTGIELRMAEYRLVKSKGRIHQYQIAMPIRGNYAQIRAFLESALVAIPVLSLDHVAFRRARISDAAVEADVRMILHLRAP